MGEASRRKKEGREVKDPLRFQRANIFAYSQREAQLAAAYHQALAAREAAEKKLEESVAKLTAEGHPFYKPTETAAAPEATASEVPPYSDDVKPVADADVVSREEMGHGEE